MPLRSSPLPRDIDELTRIVLALEAENAELRVHSALLKQLIFGPKSEKLATIDQMQSVLDLGDLSDVPVAANDDAAPEGDAKRRKCRSASRNIGALPKHLPRCEDVIEPESTACPCCSLQRHRIGEDIFEALDVVPAILRVIRTIRPKYACRSCESAIVQAPARPRVTTGGMLSDEKRTSSDVRSWPASASKKLSESWRFSPTVATPILPGQSYGCDVPGESSEGGHRPISRSTTQPATSAPAICPRKNHATEMHARLRGTARSP